MKRLLSNEGTPNASARSSIAAGPPVRSGSGARWTGAPRQRPQPAEVTCGVPAISAKVDRAARGLQPGGDLLTAGDRVRDLDVVDAAQVGDGSLVADEQDQGVVRVRHEGHAQLQQDVRP